MASKVTIDIEHRGAVAIARPVGRLNSAEVEVLDSQLKSLLRQGRSRVVIDFAAVSFIASSGLRILLLVRKKIHDKNGALVLCNVQPHVESVFRVSGFHRMLDMVPDMSEALRHARPPGDEGLDESAAARNEPAAPAAPTEAPETTERRREHRHPHTRQAGQGRQADRDTEQEGGVLQEAWNILALPWRIVKALLNFESR